MPTIKQMSHQPLMRLNFEGSASSVFRKAVIVDTVRDDGCYGDTPGVPANTHTILLWANLSRGGKSKDILIYEFDSCNGEVSWGMSLNEVTALMSGYPEPRLRVGFSDYGFSISNIVDIVTIGLQVFNAQKPNPDTRF